MKNAIKILMMITALACAQAANAGSEGRNGGGGIFDGGVYMTFYTSGLYVEPGARQQPDVPGLSELVAYINRLWELSDSSKNTLINQILPTSQHQYFTASADSFDEAVRNRLIEEFERVTHVPVDKLRLFALTDTSTGKTFLLPEFFKLKLNDQMTILFHEAYWLLHPNTTYQEVVDAEMAFEAMLDKPQDHARIMDFLKYSGSHKDQLAVAVYFDKTSGALQGFLKTGPYGLGFPLSDLLGWDYYRCVNAGAGDCNKYLNVHLGMLESQYPRSLFLQRVAKNIFELGMTGSPKLSIHGLYDWDRREAGRQVHHRTAGWIEIAEFRGGTESCVVEFDVAAAPDSPDVGFFPLRCGSLSIPNPAWDINTYRDYPEWAPFAADRLFIK